MDVYKTEIIHQNQMTIVQELFKSQPPNAAAFDTEANSLHIIDGRLFLFQFGWYSTEHDVMHVYLVDKSSPDYKEIIKLWHGIVKYSPVYLGHNVKYDLHMVANEDLPYAEDNISDTLFYIRAAHDNISTRHGGVRLGLKYYAKKYIDPDADAGDRAVQSARSAIAKFHNNRLKQALGWTLKQVDDFFKDRTNTTEDFPTVNALVAYSIWHDSLPEELQFVYGRLKTDDIPYSMVDPAIMKAYAYDDIVLTLRIHMYTSPVITQRGTWGTIEFENKCIYPLWHMERQGLHVDKEYVNMSFFKMKRYIRQRRQDLKDLTGMNITANQHKLFKEYLEEHGLVLAGTGDDVLTRVPIDHPNHPTLPAISCVQELRTLEKWLSTYLFRMMGQDKMYTQINQVGAASLRMSSDFQQFPKHGIVDKHGAELFNPRRAIVPPPGKVFVFIDYSQIELRVQALYTILLGEPDLNLCRAFMPYNCYMKQVRTPTSNPLIFYPDIFFDYNNKEHLTKFNNATWYHNEDNEQWHPVDVHGATTKAAFNIAEDHPDYKDLRSMGKRVNFAKNYGATKKQIYIMFPDLSEKEIRAIDGGYYKAFPSILTYHRYCESLAVAQPYATNLFGIRYWGVNGHTLKNMLVQGSSAIYLKDRINAVHEQYANHPSIKLVMPVHDEIIFTMEEKDLHLVPSIVTIMQKWDDASIPIVADTEISRTNWYDKEDL